MISHDHRCIFVHIPRTGGTSIENLIWPRMRTPRDLWMGLVDPYRNKYQTGGLQHLLARHIRDEVGADVFFSYYKFAIVRNPWDRAVSQFSYMAKRQDLRDFIGMKVADEFKKYLDLIAKKEHVQWLPQIDFLLDSDGQMLVDHVGRFETFSDSVLRVLGDIGIKADTLPHENKSRREPYQGYYDAESNQIIAAMYARDIAAFGYRFD